MNLTRLVVAQLLVFPLALACGGKTSSSAPPDGGRTVTETDGGVEAASDGGACIDLRVTSADLACTTDDDCEFATIGEVCPDDCCGGGSVVNTSAATRLGMLTSSIAFSPACKGVDCGAPIGEPVCNHGVCAACETSSVNGTLCDTVGADGGTVTTTSKADAGTRTGRDSGTTTITADAGPGCVDIDLSTYDLSCQQASDCILVPSGVVCTGNCDCGGSPVSASEQSRIDQALSGITLEQCPCPASTPPQCLNGTCAVCDGPGNESPGCPGKG
jgi:hypothetical protein